MTTYSICYRMQFREVLLSLPLLECVEYYQYGGIGASCHSCGPHEFHTFSLSLPQFLYW